MKITFPENATHVLYRGGDSGGWILAAATDRENPAGAGRTWAGPAYRAQDPAELAGWASAQLGYTVTVMEQISAGAEVTAYALRPDLLSVCTGFFVKYPSAVTSLDDEAFSRLIRIRSGGQDYRLIHFRHDTDGSGPFCRLFGLGEVTGFEIDADGTVHPGDAGPAATRILTGARVPYPDGTYTAPEVFNAAEADPDDPEAVDWDSRRRLYPAVPFDVVDGKPRKPGHATGIRAGRGQLWCWGPQDAVDAVVTLTYRGVRRLLTVWRKDGHGAGTPGGMIDPGDIDVVAALLRELQEETGLVVADRSLVTLLPARVMDDPRGTDQAWLTSTPGLIDLGEVPGLPCVRGSDDAARSEWVPARSIGCFRTALARDYGGTRVFPAHIALLTEILGTTAGE